MLHRQRSLRNKEDDQGQNREPGLLCLPLQCDAHQQHKDGQKACKTDNTRMHKRLEILVVEIVADIASYLTMRTLGGIPDIHVTVDVLLIQKVLAVSGTYPKKPGMVLI